MSLTTDQGKAATALFSRLDRLESRVHRLIDERDRLEAAIDRHRADTPGTVPRTPDAALYAVLREIREARDADAGIVQGKKVPAAEREAMGALRDALSGLAYVRLRYGALDGVGWDRIDEYMKRWTADAAPGGRDEEGSE